MVKPVLSGHPTLDALNFIGYELMGKHVEKAYDFASKNRLLKSWYNLHPENLDDLKETNFAKTDSEVVKSKLKEYSEVAGKNAVLGHAEALAATGTFFGIITLALAEPQFLSNVLKEGADFIVNNTNLPPETVYKSVLNAVGTIIYVSPFVLADGVARNGLNQEEYLRVVCDSVDKLNAEFKKENVTVEKEEMDKLTQTKITSF